MSMGAALPVVSGSGVAAEPRPAAAFTAEAGNALPPSAPPVHPELPAAAVSPRPSGTPAAQRPAQLTGWVVALAAHAALLYGLLHAPAHEMDGGGGRLADAISVTLVSSQASESRETAVAQPDATAAEVARVDETDGAAPLPPAREATPGDDAEKREEKTEAPAAEPVPPVEAIAEAPAEPERRKQDASALSAGGVSARGEADAPPQSARAGASAGIARDYSRQVSMVLSRTKPRTVYETGVVEVEFRIAPDGTLASVGVSRSSGNAKVDELAVAALQKARFPAPPPTMTTEQLFYRTVYTFTRGGGRSRYR